MKKYPFSKKAVQAMLAAAIAFSPVAGFGAAQVQADVTVAEDIIPEYTMEELIERLDQVYTVLNEKGEYKTLIEPIKEKVANKEINLESYANEIVKDEEYKGLIEDMLAGIVDISLSTSKVELEESILNLRSKILESEQLFGENGLTVDQVQNLYFSAISEYNSAISQLDSANIDKKTLDSVLKVSLKNIKLDINTLIQIESIIKYDETKSAIIELVHELDSTGAARVAFAKAVKSTEPVTPPPGGGSGGGAPVTPPTPPTPETGKDEVAVPEKAAEVVKETNQAGKTEVVTKVTKEKVSEIANLVTSQKPVVALQLAKPEAGEVAKAQVPASLFTEAAKKSADAAINIKTEEASYKLPASEIKVDELAKELGVTAGEVEITVAVNVVEPTAEEVADFVKNNKPVSKIIEFEVKAVSGDKEVHVTTYRYYVDRVINLDSEVSTSAVNASAGAKLNANNLAGVRINEDGTFSPVPTVFDGDKATIKSLTNSKYTIVENSKTFTDVDNGANYFEANIEKLASKYIINGKTDSTYAPSADITRGEFAALISRSLGLIAKNPAEVKFPDVPATKAVNKNGEINAAVEAGIIQGFPDGNFKPDQPMTRAEAAIMIDRAMNFTKVADSKLDKTKKITGLADHASISNTSRDSILKVYQAGIMGGFKTGEFGPYENTQRDQMAKVLDEFLKVAGMIN
ncbi:S-layer homology domain-containing protein [Bacillus tuaregi]|uniref:S-layer homology domain-containing protein n=1 Tax=Bacillus tuaregi TaxID=1816695 RepID=UPI0008F923FE|nr:S-layer homology domain-containing protein [Bacillus tuaregi]